MKGDKIPQIVDEKIQKKYQVPEICQMLFGQDFHQASWDWKLPILSRGGLCQASKARIYKFTKVQNCLPNFEQ